MMIRLLLTLGFLATAVVLPHAELFSYAQYERESEVTLPEFRWPEGKRMALSLTFDDARPSQLENAVPILDRHGVKATFYVNPQPLAARAADWRAVAASGHEIGNHSATHPCTGNFLWSRDRALESQTLETIAADIDRATREIEDLIGVRTRTFAYPCGQTFVGRGLETRSYVPVVAERFLAGRGWLGEGPNDPAFCDLAQLLGMEFDGLTFASFRTLIEQAAERGAWLVLCGHDVGESGRQTVLASTLEEVCRFASDPANGVWIDAVERIAGYILENRAVSR
jgi:peptidoglycan-N-acetylglucosamine deacetylase